MLCRDVETRAAIPVSALHQMGVEPLHAVQGVHQNAAQAVRTLPNPVGVEIVRQTALQIARILQRQVDVAVARRDVQMIAAAHVNVYVRITVIIYAKTHVPEGVIILA